ncbi:MAG: LysR family transcriptional regulator [Pseudomonadota bacterium]
MNLSTRQIRAFATVARLRSFTRAAEQLHITQAGLSSMVRDTEAQLGCRLFDRTTRAVSLTPQGAAFLPIAERVLADLEDGVASLDQISSATSASLRVGATPLVASSLLPHVCATFGREHPEVRVSVEDLYRSEIQQSVQAGSLDVGYGVFLEAASGVRRLALYKAPLVLVLDAARYEALPRSDGIRWKDIAPLPLLSLPVDNPIQRLVDQHLAVVGRANEARRTFQHLHTILAMVEARAGCALLPSFIASAACRYRVGSVLVQPRVPIEFFEISKSGRDRSPQVEAFGRHLVRAMHDYERGQLHVEPQVPAADGS